MDPLRRANDGDTIAHLNRIAEAGEPGALIRLELPQHPRTNPEVELRLLLHAWQQLQTSLLGKGIGFCGAYQSETVVAGERDKLTNIALALFDRLLSTEETRRLVWHIVLIDVFGREPIRTAMCDPGYDLDPNVSLLAWVDPYAHDDWRDSQRYPHTTIVRKHIHVS